MTTRGCPRATVWRTSCKRRDCEVCGQRWGRDWLSATRLNLESFGRPVALLTITAPGADVLPWDRSRCKVRDPERHRCSGRRGCRVVDRDAREWADTANLRWGWLRRAARQAVARAGLQAPILLERVWELQLRGVPHLHLILPFGTPAERAATQRFAGELARLAPDYGWGFVDTRLQGRTAAEAAKYLSGYLVGKGSKRKASIRETAQVEAERRRRGMDRLPRSLLWLTPTLTRASGITIRSLRRARHLWACANDPFVPRPSWSSFADEVTAQIAFVRLFRGREDDEPPPLEPLYERLEQARLLDWHVRALVLAPYRARELWAAWTRRPLMEVRAAA